MPLQLHMLSVFEVESIEIRPTGIPGQLELRMHGASPAIMPCTILITNHGPLAPTITVRDTPATMVSTEQEDAESAGQETHVASDPIGSLRPRLSLLKPGSSFPGSGLT